MSRRFVAAALCLAVFAGSCSTSDSLNEPRCEGASTVLIVAQSVPSAQMLPCFNPLPVGWDIEDVDISNLGTTVTFESDRAGDSAATFGFDETCDVGDAVSIPSDYQGVEAFELVEEIKPRFRAKRYYQFDGGCVSWDFDFDGSAPSGLAHELGQSLMLMSRSDVNDSFRESFVDEDL